MKPKKLHINSQKVKMSSNNLKSSRKLQKGKTKVFGAEKKEEYGGWKGK